MNKKYLIALLILSAFLIMCLLGDKCFFDTEFLLPSAWGEEPIEDTIKWQKLIENASLQEMSGNDINKILDILRRAETEDFPIDPLLNKALEGIAKRVSPSAIAKVLESRLEHFYTCQRILGKITEIEKDPVLPENDLLIIMSESMARGVSREELEKLVKHAPKPLSVHLAHASQDVATLKDLGFSSEDAMEIVQTGLQNGIYIERNRGISITVRQGREKGMTNQELKDLILSNIHRGHRMEGIFHERSNQRHLRQQSGGNKSNSRGGPRFRPR
jgi:hypothetical protein